MLEPQGTLDDIIPEARRHFEALFSQAERLGLEPSIGWAGAGRTCAQQNSLSPTATSASGCQSWHVLGRAVDMQLRPWSREAYRELGEWWERRGGFWGGRWTHLDDPAHFHWPEAGFPAGSPPGCPSSRAACEEYRRAYLAEAAEWRSLSPLWAVVAGLGAAGAYVWWRRRA